MRYEGHLIGKETNRCNFEIKWNFYKSSSQLIKFKSLREY